MWSKPSDLKSTYDIYYVLKLDKKIWIQLLTNLKI
jgi:hypothetical protein